MQFPSDDRTDLALVQPFLVLQAFFPEQNTFSMELIITDTTKTKRRIDLTTAVKEISLKYFNVFIPFEGVVRGSWVNLCIDIISFMEIFKGSTFRSLDGIIIGSSIKLRRIYTIKSPIYEPNYGLEMKQMTEIPKNLNFPQGIPFTNVNFSMQRIKMYLEQKCLNPSHSQLSLSMIPSKKQISTAMQTNLLDESVLSQSFNPPDQGNLFKVDEEEKIEFHEINEVSNIEEDSEQITLSRRDMVEKALLELKSEKPMMNDKEIKDFKKWQQMNKESVETIMEKITPKDLEEKKLDNTEGNENPWKFSNPMDVYEEIEKSHFNRRSSCFKNYKNQNRRFSHIQTNADFNRKMNSKNFGDNIHNPKHLEQDLAELRLENPTKTQTKLELNDENKETNKLHEKIEQRNSEDEEEVELVYDPVLKSYYDPKTNNYYDIVQT